MDASETRSADPPSPAAGHSPQQRTDQQRTERFDLRALYETSSLLSSSLELDFVLGNLLLTALSKLLVTRGAVLLWRPAEGGYRVAATKGGTQMEEGTVLALDDERRSLDRDDDGEPMRGAGVPAPLRERGVALALPLRSGERRLGLLVLGPKATGAPFADAEVEFVASLASMSAAAVGNALLVEELRTANRDLDGKVQQMNTLFDLSQEMGAIREEARLGKLLSYALMGQMAVRRHLFLLRQDDDDAEDDSANGPRRPFQTVVRGGGADDVEVTPALTEAICGRRKLVRPADEDGASWDALAEAGFDIVLPIRHRDEVCAALALGPKLTGAPYETGDIEFLYSLGNLAYTSLRNARLLEEQIEKERLEQEIALARQAQQRLLPQQLPAANGVELAARTVPSREVGGDYYDVLSLPGRADDESERLLLAIADVTGKGVAASLLMANVQAARKLADQPGQSAGVVARAGPHPEVAHTLDYVNAGHNPPMLLRAGGELERLETGGLLLGVMSGADYDSGRVELAEGDTLAIFTDGATEAMNPDDEEFGEARLAESLRAHRDVSAEGVLDAVFEDVRAFAGAPAPLGDDLTMVVLRVP
ncbi:MAG: protein serine phosphatase [Bacteroidetes bacterium SW_4_67_19]|nr:MAG: protein serine phosphatase [Bacteroidetes bacterium SW_4_67_19]